MRFMETFRRSTSVRLVLFVVAISIVVAACSSSSDLTNAASTVFDQGGSEERPASGGDADLECIEETQAFKAVAEDGSVVFETTSPQIFDARIIRDGRLDLRIDPGTFGVNAEEIRKIAADLGGYVASGETYIEEYDDDRYAVGWYTMRIPTDRFDDAVARVERLGERVSASLSSQDVTEEYVDLEGRLSYWRQQEQFYSALMAEATTVSDMIALQGQMQEVLLTLEQIEGRIRYLDSRTNFATLTVGLTEVPNGPTVVPEPTDSGPIVEAFDQAGEVLLATVAFIIVSAAVAIPIGILVLMVYGALRLVLSVTRRRENPSEG